MMPKGIERIGVLAGGPSSEREISLESGRAVFDALSASGHDTVFLDIKDRLTKKEIGKFNIDVAFIALHGRFGEDGTIQQMLEELNIPYTGSDPRASRMALDKIASKEIFIKNGLEVPAYQIADRNDLDYGDLENNLVVEFPVVVKPQFEGSSIGISIVKSREGLREAAELALRYGDKIIIERYIKGRELTVGILDDEPLPVVEIIAGEQFYDFKAKYKSAHTRYMAPARIPPRVYADAQRKGKAAHDALGCRTFSRTDMLFDEERQKIFVLEVNSIPGLTGHSLLPKAASCAGIDFKNLCLKIIESSLRKAGRGKIGQAV